MRRTTWWRLGVSLVLGASYAATVFPAGAASAHWVTVRSSLHGEQPLSPDTSLCSADGLTFNGADQQPYSGTSTYTGTFTGTGEFCGYLEAIPDQNGDIAFVETDRFTGTVLGCGTGAVVYDVTGTVSPRRPDSAHVALGAAEKWTIRSGSGTRGLVGLSGSGEDPARVNLLPTLALPPTMSVDATFLGRVRCVPASGGAARTAIGAGTATAHPGTPTAPSGCTAAYPTAPRCQYVASRFANGLYVTASRWQVTVLHRLRRKVSRTVYEPTHNTDDCFLHSPLLPNAVMMCSAVTTSPGDLVIVRVGSPGQVTAGDLPCYALPTCWWSQANTARR